MGRRVGILGILILLWGGGATGDEAQARVAMRFAATPPQRHSPRPPHSPHSPQQRTGELAAAKFLIASENVRGPFFSESVVLLLEYGPGGALGVIINRPTGTPLATVLPNLQALRQRQDTIYMGGPVGRDAMAFLIRSKEAPPESTHLRDDLHVSGSSKALRHVVETKLPADRFRAYVGYAGWMPGQLDAEVLRGDWYIATAQAAHIFETSAEDVWPRLIREHRGVHVRSPRVVPLRATIRAADQRDAL